MMENEEPRTPLNKNKSVNSNLVIPPSPYLEKLGYGTGKNIIQKILSRISFC